MSEVEQPPDAILEALQEEMDAIRVYPAYTDDDPRAAPYAMVEQYLELHNRCDDDDQRLEAGIAMYRKKCLSDIKARRDGIDYKFGLMGIRDAVDKLKGKAQSLKTTKGQIGWRRRGADTVNVPKDNKAEVIAMCHAEYPELLTTTTPAPETDVSKELMAEYLRANPLSELHGLVELKVKGERTFYHKPPKEIDDGREDAE